MRLNAPNYPREGAGKFITVYPADDAQLVALAEQLHRATEGVPAPAILSDRPYLPGSAAPCQSFRSMTQRATSSRRCRPSRGLSLAPRAGTSTRCGCRGRRRPHRTRSRECSSGGTERHGRSTRGNRRLVLAGLDLDVPAGLSVALVGRSGSGKSTLASLAGRLADPDRGTVRIDGVNMRNARLADVRRAVAYAFERPALLGEDLHALIAYGRPGSTRLEVEAAARTAQADGFIRRLPDAYATAPSGAPLSGGERQRLGLAQAILQDAPRRPRRRHELARHGYRGARRGGIRAGADGPHVVGRRKPRDDRRVRSGIGRGR
jgi:ABC-type multidrug transport system fused ATPase/permease subunit